MLCYVLQSIDIASLVDKINFCIIILAFDVTNLFIKLEKRNATFLNFGKSIFNSL